jgi:hypothetical protein
VVPPFFQVLSPGDARSNKRIHLVLRQRGELFLFLIDKAKKSHGDLFDD